MTFTQNGLILVPELARRSERTLRRMMVLCVRVCVCVCGNEEGGILGYSVVEYDPFFTLIQVRLFDGICS